MYIMCSIHVTMSHVHTQTNIEILK